jgi:hypothetical protein
MRDKDAPLIVAYGMGLNSTALLVEMVRRAWRPDLILSADTGGERPETYAYCAMFSNWLVERDFPAIQTVRNTGMYGTLEKNCLDKAMLPSLAYGFKSCSDKYKRRPQDKFVRHWAPAQEAWKTGHKVVKLIGIDYGESRRAGITEDEKYTYRYPLVEWRMDREACVRVVRDAGLAEPAKSSCFFCPATTKKEILRLAQEHPDLLVRAIAMERKAAPNLQSVQGLGRRFNWEQFIAGEQTPGDAPDQACLCFDGEGEDT